MGNEQPALEVDARLPGGATGTIKFKERLTAQEWLLFILILMQSLLLWVVIQQESDRERRYGGTAASLAMLVAQGNANKADHLGILDLQKTLAAEQRIQTYVLTLDEKGRKGLNLREPEELRNRR